MFKLVDSPTRSPRRYRLLDQTVGNRAVITIEAASIAKAKEYHDVIERAINSFSRRRGR